MSLTTFSKFYYIDPVLDNNLFLNFIEGVGPELTAELDIGEYTATDLGEIVENALNSAGALTYTVTFDRLTRRYTISATGVFTLLIATGSNNGVDIFPTLGFTGADTASLSSHTSNIAAGFQYAPQYILQDHVDHENNQQSISASITETASADVEVVSFGVKKSLEFDIQFATDILQPNFGPIKNNPTGVNDLRQFMVFVTKKYPVEYMPNALDPNVFFNILLDKTDKDSKGTGFKLKEQYDKGLPNFFSTGVLSFRVIE